MSHLVLLLIGSAVTVTHWGHMLQSHLMLVIPFRFGFSRITRWSRWTLRLCSISALCLRFDGCLVEFLWLASSTGWLTCLSGVCCAAARTQSVVQEAASLAATFQWISFEDKWAVIASIGNVEQWLEVCQDIVQFFFFLSLWSVNIIFRSWVCEDHLLFMSSV